MDTLACVVSLHRDVTAEGVLQVVEWDDIRSVGGCDMTNGGGLMSADVAALLPCVDGGVERAGEGGGALAAHARLWALGSVWKGVWCVHASLPPRTILAARQCQRKVKGRPGCVAEVLGRGTFEVSGRDNHARRCAAVPTPRALRVRSSAPSSEGGRGRRS